MCLQDLPPELILLVGQKLPQKDLSSLILTSGRYPHILTTTLYGNAFSFVPIEYTSEEATGTFYQLPSGEERAVDFDYAAVGYATEWQSDHVLEFFKKKDINLFVCWDTTGTTLFHRFAAQGATRILKILLDRGADINARMIGGYTPLAWMINTLRTRDWDDYMPLIRLFLKKGADVLVKDEEEQSLLIEAVKTAPRYAVSFIIEVIQEAGGDIWARDKDENGPFWHAIKSGNFDAVTVLLELGADVMEEDENGSNSLHRAADAGNPKTCKAIMAAMQKADLHAVNGDNYNALDMATYSGNDRAAALFIEAGLDPTRKEDSSETPLDQILRHGLTRAFEALLKHTSHLWPLQKLERAQLLSAIARSKGRSIWMMVRLVRLGAAIPFSPAAEDVSYSAFHAFCANWNRVADPKKVASCLLELGERVNVLDTFGSTPLHILLVTRNVHDDSNQYLELVGRLLYEHKTPLTARDENGNTILHYAAGHGDIRLLQMVINNIDKPTLLARNNQGFTALHCAVNPRCRRSHLDKFSRIAAVSNCYPSKPVISLLLSKGIYIDAKTNRGSTALHMASCDKSKVSAVKALIEAGADVGAPDYNGYPPLHWANVSNCDEAAEALLTAGADLHEGCCHCDPRLWSWKELDEGLESSARMRTLYGETWSEVLNEADMAVTEGRIFDPDY